MADGGTWAKPDPELVDRFHEALPEHPAAERRKMFGYPACFVNGHFFAGLHQQNIVVRLPGDIRDRFGDLAAAEGFDARGTGRPMKDWYVIPAEVRDDPARLTNLLDGTFAEVLQLPPKEPKPRGRRTRGT